MKKSASTKKTDDVFNGMVQHLTELAGETKKLVKEAKSRFDKADEQTKKKVIAGLASAAALFVAAASVHRIRKQHHRKKKG